ncbi:MAG TPA: sulfotransferase [Vicingus sp.]|nr:sulfotransferase [Vicingus sp.]HRP59195.1 sulfotransferase [Vicingus sp.]
MIRSIIKKCFIKTNLSAKVNLFIIGAQKCGTSTLFDNLIKHKKIIGGVKEKNFFSHPYLFLKGLDWYYSLFHSKKIYFDILSKNYYVDASPSYLPSKEVAKRIHSYNPNAKIIVMMRNPIDRAFSAWNMYKQMNLLSDDEKESLIRKFILGQTDEEKDKFVAMINLTVFPTFEEMVEQELHDIKNNIQPYPGILKRGIYHEQIEKYHALFSHNQFFYICSEEFKKNKTGILIELFDFLSLENVVSTEKLEDKHKREYQNKMSPEIRENLKIFYEPYNQKLFSLINKTYNWE